VPRASNGHPGGVQLAKHHGLGNDFLVGIDLDVDAAMAVALCDRRRGIGADGLIGLRDGRMTLFNGDGSRAEMSGNGIRCLAQAIARHRGVAALDEVVETDAGPRRLVLRATDDPATVEVEVDMGEARLLRIDEREAEVDMGNPHLVLLVDDTGTVDLLAVGRRHPDVNLEIIAPDGGGGLTLRVHERGVGITQACGTGACAAAAAARKWGLVGDEVTVRMPGGDVVVGLGEATTTLTGPATHVADIEVAWP
jgi:diaminopimelate epimerase